MSVRLYLFTERTSFLKAEIMGKRVNIDSKQTSILKSKDMQNTDKNNLIKRTDSNLKEGDIISRPSLGRNSYKLNSNIRTRKCFI